jgi:hypothetical protein
VEAITHATKDPVFELIDRCCEAWKKCDDCFGTGAGRSPPQ